MILTQVEKSRRLRDWAGSTSNGSRLVREGVCGPAQEITKKEKRTKKRTTDSKFLVSSKAGKRLGFKRQIGEGK